MTWRAIVLCRMLSTHDRAKIHSHGINPTRRVPDDGEALTDIYNAELEKLTEKGKGTWLTVPWLYSE